MFPFSRSFSFKVDASMVRTFRVAQLIDSLSDHLDVLKIKSSTIYFSNFNVFYKRHKWLDDGILEIVEDGKGIKISIRLNFISTPIIFLFTTAALFVLQFEKLHIAFTLVVILWLLFSLMYLWTTTLFKSSIKRIVKQQIYIQQTENLPAFAIIDKNCPACGQEVTKQDKFCPNCGINFI